MDAGTDAQTVAGIRTQLDEARHRLSEAGARDEALAVFVPPRRILSVFTKKAAMVPAGRVWRLGVFLLDRDGTLYATGSTTRAVPPGYPGHQSLSAESRREYRAAAYRGPFAPGETINFDARRIELEGDDLHSAGGPLFLRNGSAWVRWSASAGDDAAMAFPVYLGERVDLLVNPPAGA